MIAIHNGSSSFHKSWIDYCQRKNIPFRLVNCFSTDIISQLDGCNVLMWHHSQNDPKALIAAKPILFALEHAGIKVFPDFRSNWHFDNKLGQKYLFEGLKIPSIPTWVFYDRKKALKWANEVSYPKVFKLSRGAGSSNVRLVRNKRNAIRLINKAFCSGFASYNGYGNLLELFRKWKEGNSRLVDILKGIARLFIPPEYQRRIGRESGVIYFQEFIANNNFDIRVIVIGEKAFAVKRLVRKNDFRASGSGYILYEKHHFNIDWIKLAFFINEKINSQSLALDYLFNNGEPIVSEISFGFVKEGYDPCPGYWDKDLNWHEGSFNPCDWMVDLFVKEES